MYSNNTLGWLTWRLSRHNIPVWESNFPHPPDHLTLQGLLALSLISLETPRHRPRMNVGSARPLPG